MGIVFLEDIVGYWDSELIFSRKDAKDAIWCFGDTKSLLSELGFIGLKDFWIG
jgi:hypothetical protein